MPTGGPEILALASAIAWASGLNLYAAILVLGGMQVFGIVDLPGHLALVARPEVLGVAGALYLVQFIADKIPGLDHLSDSVQTFVRVPAGAFLAASAYGALDPAWHIAALIAGGALALGTHATKASGRLFVNTHLPFIGTAAASLAEDAAVLGGLYLAATHPASFLGALAVLIIVMGLTLWLLTKFVLFLARMVGGLFARR